MTNELVCHWSLPIEYNIKSKQELNSIYHLEQSADIAIKGSLQLMIDGTTLNMGEFWVMFSYCWWKGVNQWLQYHLARGICREYGIIEYARCIKWAVVCITLPLQWWFSIHNCHFPQLYDFVPNMKSNYLNAIQGSILCSTNGTISIRTRVVCIYISIWLRGNFTNQCFMIISTVSMSMSLSTFLGLYPGLSRYLNPDSKVYGPTWDPHGSSRPQMGPMCAPWTLLSGLITINVLICSV